MNLITWNTQWCRGLDGAVSPQRIVEGARAMADFDVLCLQEIAQGFDDMPGAPGDQPAQLRALLPGFRLFFGAAVDEFSAAGTRRRFGNLIATRLPVAMVQHHTLPWPVDAGVSSMPRMCTAVTLRDPRIGAIRVLTAHLEFYSKPQRLAQAQALRALHVEACERAAAPPLPGDAATPFAAKAHTPHAILCGDFNFERSDPEYAAIGQPSADSRLHDAWSLLRAGEAPAPTFHLFDRSYSPEPVACDYVFVSDSLLPRLRHIEVDGHTRASDHQPVLVAL